MTLQDLRYLVALADHGHFGRAAAACHISQPTLSTQLKKLEDQLGAALFERTNKSVHVTAFGEEILVRARRILAEAEAILEAGRRKSGPLSGPLRLGVIPTLGPYLLPWLVPALRAEYPALRLVVREDLTAPLLERLAAYRLDAALAALPVSEPALESLPLFDEPFWFAAPRDHALAQAESVSEADLRGQRLLLLTEGHCLRDQALAVCDLADAESGADGDFRATSLETLRQMVATGLGVTLLPALALAAPDAHAIALRPLASGAGRRIGLIWRRGYSRMADLHLLADTLRAHLPAGVRRA